MAAFADLMRAMRVYLPLLCASTLLLTSEIVCKPSPKIWADFTSNRFSREHDGTLGMWSFHGTANRSLARIREFVFNGDLLDGAAFARGVRVYRDLATETPPVLGLTSDLDETYLLYQVLQARVVGIDGFIVEWGYRGHQSDLVLRKLLEVVTDLGQYASHFKIGINWCDHWLKAKLEDADPDRVAASFAENAAYLLEEVFRKYRAVTLHEEGRPLLYLFGGGLSAQEFRVLKKRLGTLGRDDVTWVGNYFRLGEPEGAQWRELLDGTFGWIPHARRPARGTAAEHWDFVTAPQDTVPYQKNVSTLARAMVDRGMWRYWSLSAVPGEDNRGCAGWGGSLSLLKRRSHSKDTYDVQWAFALWHADPPAVFLVTYNDFGEGTAILPTRKHRFSALAATALYGAILKQVWPADSFAVRLPFAWWKLKRDLDFWSGVSGCEEASRNLDLHLRAAAFLIAKRHFANGRHFLHYVRRHLHELQRHAVRKTLVATSPRSGLVPVNGGISAEDVYPVNGEQILSLALAEDLALTLRTEQYTGLLTFQYRSDSDTFGVLRVRSSGYPTRADRATDVEFVTYPRSPDDGPTYRAHSSDFTVVCELAVANGAASWHDAAVELFKSNQLWIHNLPHGADLEFSVRSPSAAFAVRNISARFFVYEGRERRPTV